MKNKNRKKQMGQATTIYEYMYLSSEYSVQYYYMVYVDKL